MKQCLTIFLMLIPLISKPCGGDGYYEDGFFYYNLFEQTNIAEKGYYPFLRTDYERFFHAENGLPADWGNLTHWQALLTGWSQADIRKVLYEGDKAGTEQLWKGKDSAIEEQAKAYMAFANACSNAVSFRKTHSWRYADHQQKPDFAPTPLVEQGNKGFATVTDKQLKARYAYQIVRLLHYAGRYQEAIDFYEQKAKLLWLKGEAYYYLLDQVAGCYYSLGNYELAAYLFLQVFGQSVDRKKSAYVSYSFCRNKQAEGKRYFVSSNDVLTHELMKSLGSFGANTSQVKKMYDMAPGDERTALAFMRALNDTERSLMPTFEGLEGSPLPRKAKGDVALSLLTIAKDAVTNPKVANKGFWQAATSYLYFLSGNIAQAQANLKTVDLPEFKKQASRLAKVYEVFSWEKMTPQREQVLMSIVEKIKLPDNMGSRLYPYEIAAWQEAIFEHAAHLYYKEGHLAQAFFVHNQAEDAERINSPQLIDALIAFSEKGNKSPFEQWLINKSNKQHTEGALKAYFSIIKAHNLLQDGQNQAAEALLAKHNLEEIADFSSALDQTVSARIFSNNIKECYDCEPLEVMVDSVYLANVFAFIQPQFSRKALAQNLNQLEQLTQDERAWKRKLAHYLLANYYFNVSNTGYFRGVLKGLVSSTNSFPFFDQDEPLAADMIRNKEGYNFLGIASHQKLYHALAQKAYTHYQKVIELSTDKALNARCLYMMAKCELNAYYNTTSLWYYDGGLKDGAAGYKKSFKTLREDYADTEFYSMIIKECSWFRYYVNY